MNNRNKTSIIIFVFLAILAATVACKNNNDYNREIAFIDSLIIGNPDSAYANLMKVKPHVDSLNQESINMRYIMNLAFIQNKLYMQLPSESIFQNVVSYYENQGEANDCMKAKYLMGCIYRDNKEAPMALKLYKEAIECADTTSNSCDYATLLCVYSQLGELYYQQYFPEKALQCFKQQSYYAMKSSDTYNFIRGIDLQIQPYYLMADTSKILELTDSVYNLYIENRMRDKAARVYLRSIYIYLNRNEYSQARSLMDIFEHESGLFDSVGNIIDKRYQRYDYARGLYCLSQGKLTLAEDYFRQLLRDGYDQEAYDGFSKIYRIKENPDSTYKYIELSEMKLDAQLKKMQMQAITISNSMYKYSRLEQEAEKANLLAANANKKVWIILLLLILFVIFIALLFYRIVFRKKKVIKDIRIKYADSLKKLNKVIEEQNTFKESYQKMHQYAEQKDEILSELQYLIDKKNVEISELSQTINFYKNRYSKYLNRDQFQKFKYSDSVQLIYSLKKPYPTTVSLNDEIWENLLQDTNKHLPSLYENFTENGLTKLEQITTIMTFLGVSTNEISLFLGSSASNISRFKSNSNRKLFGTKTSKSLEKNIQQLIFC